MGDKMYLLLLVICLSILHHEVQAQKANLCNITESYFVEITKTETVLAPKKPGGFNLLDMFTGNKYENVTKTVLGVEKRERVVQECCTGFKKRDNECVPIYDTQPSSSTTTTTTTTTTTPAPSSTTSAPPEPPPPPPATEPVTQQTPASVPSEAAPTEPSSTAVAAAEPDPTTQPTAPEPTPAPEVSSPAPSESAPEPTSTPGTPPPTSSESPATTPEPAPSPEPTSSPETPPASPSEPLGPEAPVQTTSATDTLQQAESIVSEPSSPAQNEPMLSSLIVTTSTTPVTSKPITTPTIVSYSSSESLIPSTQPTPSNDPTTSKQFEKLVTEGAIDSTTILNSRRRRSLDKSDSDSVAAIEILEFESNTLPEDVDELSGSRKADFKLNEKTVSVESHHTRNSLDSDSDDIVVSDLTSDIEDQGYPWIEVLEVLSFGAVVFLLVITVQTSFDSETFSMWRASKKIPQEIDSYGEFWVYDSQGNLEEV